MEGTSDSTSPAGTSARAASTSKSNQKFKPLDRRDLVMIVTQLSIMTKSGVDIADAIHSVATRATKPAVRDALQMLHESLEEGNRLSQAMAAQGARFGGIMIASITAGEASGRLPEVLTRLRTLMTDELRTRNAVRSMMSYPLVLVVVTCGVLSGMVFFVLPQFASIYENSRAPTPVLTQMMLDASATLRSHWMVLVGVLAVAIFAARKAMRSKRGRLWLDRLCFRLPLVRDVCRALGLGRVFRLQGVLLESGVPLLEVLELTRAVSQNSVIQQLNDDMQHEVLVGKTMSAALAESDCVPDGATEMVATAEANGQLASVLQTVGEFFETEGEQKLRDVVKIAEPAIIVLLGVVVGAIVLAVMMPMLDLSTAGSM